MAALPAPGDEPRIFTDPEAVICGAAAATALAGHILQAGREGGELANDAEVLGYIEDGVNALLCVVTQLRDPEELDVQLRSALERWLDPVGKGGEVLVAVTVESSATPLPVAVA